ncbi:FMN-dependent NADH-azoreductase [Frankia sp. AiPa1]|uniref:FMN-dependent NADH-azoreductase n=1 Tax=Frankia sp. AiPa1 TaxID=573492 RepID=UPI00202B9977|nr:NAD(P)H-dependent oxidoreductase [Frankia sp. AiPa1]MCL9757771.1 NAD(P)H-dependent oxidoreductase [Frankia sp. AiPa1]
MSHLLHVDASLAREGSTSRALGTAFVEAWRAAHPGGTVTYRDLALTPPPHLDWDALAAAGLPPEQHTPAQAEAVKRREELIVELEAADELLLSVPPQSRRAGPARPCGRLIPPGPHPARRLRGLPASAGLRKPGGRVPAGRAPGRPGRHRSRPC